MDIKKGNYNGDVMRFQNYGNIRELNKNSYEIGIKVKLFLQIIQLLFLFL